MVCGRGKILEGAEFGGRLIVDDNEFFSTACSITKVGQNSCNTVMCARNISHECISATDDLGERIGRSGWFETTCSK